MKKKESKHSHQRRLLLQKFWNSRIVSLVGNSLTRRILTDGYFAGLPMLLGTTMQPQKLGSEKQVEGKST
jgi:hypothetical protein